MNTNNMFKQADIVPDISLMKKMASISGTIPSRVMELIDNSIDARVEGKVLEVEINVVRKKNKEYIEIIDNGHGMTELQARSFFRLGDSQKEGQKKIGRFGLGSKVAIIGLGDTCTVETSPLDENYKVNINFDIHQFKEWKIKYHLKKDKRENHGTKIKIENVTVRIGNIDRFVEKVAEQVAKSYKHFLKNGEVVIKINGKKITEKKIELIPGMHKEFDFEINGKRVYGWAGATKKAGTNWEFGFDLINNGRVIKTNDLLNRQAHTSLARLIGEIHLDDFKTDVHKTDFLRYTDDWEFMQTRLLEEELKELITKVSKLTNKEVFDKHEKEILNISNQLNSVLKNKDFLSQIDFDSTIFTANATSKEEAYVDGMKRKEDKKKEKANDVVEGSLLDLIHKMYDELKNETKNQPKQKENRPAGVGLVVNEPIAAANGESEGLKSWYVEEKSNGIHLNIEVNVDHPAYQVENEEDVFLLMKNTIIDSVAEFVLDEERKTNGIIESEINRLNEIKDLIIRQLLKNT